MVILFAVQLMLASLGFAQSLPSFCGSFNLLESSNENTENFLNFVDFSYGRNSLKVQCGLPGEKANFCHSCSSSTSEEMMRRLRPILNEEKHRQWHSQWHKIRASLHQLNFENFSSLQSKGLIAKDQKLETFAENHRIGGRLAGEDFFFMHRLMLKMAQVELSAVGLPCMAPWENVPVQDTLWPLPARSGSGVKNNKLELVKLQKQLDRFRRVEYLAGISLNRLGIVVEGEFHLRLHGYFRDKNGCSAEALLSGFCDDLLPPESSPLNKHFWKIHGLIDNLLGNWLTANGYQEIAVDCSGKKNCYTWQGNWVGPTQWNK